MTVHVPNSTQRVVNILREQIDQTRSGDHAETQNVVGEARIEREGMVSGNAPSEKGGGAGRSDEATNGSQDLSESVHLSSEVCKRAVVDKDHGSREVDESRQNTEHGRAENNAPSHPNGSGVEE